MRHFKRWLGAIGGAALVLCTATQGHAEAIALCVHPDSGYAGSCAAICESMATNAYVEIDVFSHKLSCCIDIFRQVCVRGHRCKRASEPMCWSMDQIN